MGQVGKLYESALHNIIEWADAEVVPNMDLGWLSSTSATDIEGLDMDKLDKDLKTVLIEKAAGTVHTKVNNSMPKGGIYMYTEVYIFSQKPPDWDLQNKLAN